MRLAEFFRSKCGCAPPLSAFQKEIKQRPYSEVPDVESVITMQLPGHNLEMEDRGCGPSRESGSSCRQLTQKGLRLDSLADSAVARSLSKGDLSPIDDLVQRQLKVDQAKQKQKLDLTVDTYSFPLVWWLSCMKRAEDEELLDGKSFEWQDLADADVAALLRREQQEKGVCQTEFEHRLHWESKNKVESWLKWKDDLQISDLQVNGNDFPITFKLKGIGDIRRNVGFGVSITFTFLVFMVQVFVTVLITRTCLEDAEKPATYTQTCMHLMGMLLIYISLLDEVNALIKVRISSLLEKPDDEASGCCSWYMRWRPWIRVQALTSSHLFITTLNGFCSTVFILSHRQLSHIIMSTFTLKMAATMDQLIMNGVLHFVNLSHEPCLFGVRLSWRVKQQKQQNANLSKLAKIMVVLAMATAFWVVKTKRLFWFYSTFIAPELKFLDGDESSTS